jgi:hypothetical protein
MAIDVSIHMVRGLGPSYELMAHAVQTIAGQCGNKDLTASLAMVRKYEGCCSFVTAHDLRLQAIAILLFGVAQ